MFEKVFNPGIEIYNYNTITGIRYIGSVTFEYEFHIRAPFPFVAMGTE